MDNVVKKKARPYVPFTSLNTVWRHIDSSNKTMLDAGCGKGEPTKFINRKGRYFIVGLDAFEPYLREWQKDRIHNAFIQGDVHYLPFGDKSFDVVMFLEVLEHLEKEDGEKLLKELERVARRQVILSTPAGKYKQGVLTKTLIPLYLPLKMEKLSHFRKGGTEGRFYNMVSRWI